MPSLQNKQALTVSLIIPAYNEARHLKVCLDAVAAQSVMPEEVIVVDNNSTDDTVKIAHQYPFVKVANATEQGVLYARNAGFNAATKHIIGRIDADTVLPIGWTAYVKNFYKDPNHVTTAFSGGAFFYNIRFGRFAGYMLGYIAFRFNRILLGHHIMYGSNMAMPRAMWKTVKDEVCDDPTIHEDLDLGIHLHRSGYKIAHREKLRVGVKMRRVKADHAELWENMMWWPRTLRKHGKKTWVFGWIGALLIIIVSPVVKLNEWFARRLGFTPLED